MKKLISERLAAKGLIVIISSIVVFHVFVMLGLIPHNIVWGGRLTGRTEMLQFELISILINVVMLLIVLTKAGVLKFPSLGRIVNVCLWVMALLFLVNTIGNILSLNEFEKIFFTPLTVLLSIFSLRLALSR